MKSIKIIIFITLIIVLFIPINSIGADALYRLMHNNLRMGILPFSLAAIALIIALIRSKR